MAKTTKTSAQVAVNESDGVVSPKVSAKYKTFRTMRKHPTLSLGRRYAIAPALLESWIVVGEDQSLVSVVDSQIQRFRELIVRTAMSAYHDFGWCAYELLWEVNELESNINEEGLDRGGPRRVLKAVKPLLVDLTEQVIDPKTGLRVGLKHQDQYSNEDILLPLIDSLFINFDWEGVGEYGTGSMEIAEASWLQWLEANEGAALYDKKAAGAYRLVEYPEGSTMFLHSGESEARMTPNDEIADILLKSLNASGQARIPVKRKLHADVTQDSHEKIWSLSLITAGGGVQPSFIARLKYLDALMLRACGLPERSLTEGSFGTKAEAEVHGDAALAIVHLTHERVVQAINEQIVEPFLALNYGQPGAVRLEIAPVSDETKAQALALIQLLAPVAASSSELDSVDFLGLFEQAGIPLSVSEETALTVDDVQDMVKPI